MATNDFDKQTRKLNVIVTIWLWLMIAGLVMYMFYHLDLIGSSDIWREYASWSREELYANDANILAFFNYAAAILTVLLTNNIFGIVFILLWKKAGYWVYLTSSFIYVLVMLFMGIIGNFQETGSWSMFVGIIAPIILILILQIKRNGVSCWKLLE